MPRLLFFCKLGFWILWAGMACCLCWKGPWFSPQDVESIRFYWRMMIVWTCMTGAVLSYVIFAARTSLSEFLHEDDLRNSAHLNLMNRRVITLSLIGGFSVALPAFALTFIGFIVAVPHFAAGLSESETFYSLRESPLEPSKRKPSAILFAVDISASNLPISKDPQKVDQVCDVVRTLFSTDRDGRRIIKTEDDFRPFVFAGGRELLFYSEDGNFDKEGLADKFCRELKGRLSEKAGDTSTTDIVSFLDYIYGWINLQGQNYEHVTLIMASDFLQDQPVSDQEKIENSISGFMSRIRQKEHAHLVGISMRADGKERNGVNVLPYLEKYGMAQGGEGRIWREIPLSQYTEEGADGRKALLLLSVYREVRHQEPMYLKYQVAPFTRGIQAWLKMPDDQNYELVYIGLRPSSNGDGALSKVTIDFADKADLFTLGFGGVRAPGFGTYRRQGVPLPVKLNSQLDVSRSVECELLVAVPALATVHSVRLVMVPVVGNITAEALRLTLWFLSGAVILFALAASGAPEVFHTWWAKRKGRKNAIPA